MAYNINHLLQNESSRIGPDIYDKSLNQSPWIKLIPRDTWPDEMGQAIQVMTYERTLPATTPTWSSVDYTTGTGAGSCVPTAEEVTFASTIRSYNLNQTALESPPICVNDLRFTVMRKEQLRSCFDVLQQNTRWMWQERYRDEFVRLAEHKVIVKAGFPENDTIFPAQVPTSKLTQGTLDRFYLKLLRDGGGNNAIDRVNGRPQFIAIMGPETQESVLKEIGDIRDDFRYSDRVGELLGPLGVTRPYKGFFHLIDDFPPRYNWDGSAWVRIQPYTSSAASKGTKYDLNPAWENASYEDTIIFHPEVYTSMVPKPITQPGGNTKFDPVKYMGDWKWLNEFDRDENPDKTIGFFRGVFSNGSKPIHPEYGYVLRHLRCAPELNLGACAAT
jgi:hypothetical protein|tara:strand:+ start:1297 stop:2460 length:1164 start_codon:yes stop_codon:yes gene_type:complete